MSDEIKSHAPPSVLSAEERQIISDAVDTGSAQYFEACRQRVPEFVERHYSFNGALRIHRKALGGDLLRAPANLLLGTPYLMTQASRTLLRKAGAKNLSRRLERIPPGFKTRVQKELEWLIFTELLKLPIDQDERRFEEDELLAEILSQPELSKRLLVYLDQINANTRRADFEASLQKNLNRYAGTRVAVADLACGIISLAAGAAAFHKLAPGALSTGSVLAAAIAQQSAISGFLFGQTLGSIYYGIFPAAASMGLLIASTGGVLALLGLFSAVSGIVTDPVQRRLGIHQRRLYKFIDALEQEFFQTDTSGFNPKDHYVARIFDLFDILKTAANLVH
jgi:hypothetical protein